MAGQMIECPKCGSKMPVTKAVTSKIEEGLAALYEAQKQEGKKTTQGAFANRSTLERTRIKPLVRKQADRQASERKRKPEQSSKQGHGAVAELELGDTLTKSFPGDKIERVARVRGGAEFLHKVYSRNDQFCGTILWESKYSRDWKKHWLGKLRSDQLKVKAEIAVLVSETMPSEVPHFGEIGGVWVTEPTLVVGVAMAMRVNLIQGARLKRSLEMARDLVRA